MALKDFLNVHNIKSQATYVEYGFGQVEPNHLSAQRTAQIYAQLPAAADIDVLEQGQFVKYDYANGVVNFTGKGEWMLVFNEIKLYRDGQSDCEFAMLKDNYQARIYSPFGGDKYTGAADTNFTAQTRYYNGKDAAGNTFTTVPRTFTVADTDKSIVIEGVAYPIEESKFTYNEVQYTVENGKVTVPVKYMYDDVTAAKDPYEIHTATEDPFHIESPYMAKKMPEGTTMVPRVFKTNVGDIFTTNTVKATELSVGQILTPGAKGILEVTESQDGMLWQVVKVYDLADRQRAVKIMRIQ